MCGAYFNTIIIHPICAIDEYARIFRICVWFNAPQLPTSADNRPSVIVNE